MTMKSEILRLLAENPAGLSDGELRRRLGAVHQHVNQAARGLEAQGLLIRDPSSRPLTNRLASAAVAPSPRADEPAASPTAEPAATIALIACSKRKRDAASTARDLYQGDLFRKAVADVERRGIRWFVVSAKWGLIAPDDVVAPYDVRLDDQSRAYRIARGEFVAARLASEVALAGLLVEIHAGEAYAGPLREPLQRLDATVVEPLQGQSQGRRLATYVERAAAVRAARRHPRRKPTCAGVQRWQIPFPTSADSSVGRGHAFRTPRTDPRSSARCMIAGRGQAFRSWNRFVCRYRSSAILRSHALRSSPSVYPNV